MNATVTGTELFNATSWPQHQGVLTPAETIKLNVMRKEYAKQIMLADGVQNPKSIGGLNKAGTEITEFLANRKVSRNAIDEELKAPYHALAIIEKNGLTAQAREL